MENELNGTDPAEAPETWRDWMVVAASLVALTFSVTHIYSMGTFILPIEADTGWSRGEITGGLTVVSVFAVALSPFIGLLIDRIGSRPIALVGVGAFCAALAAVSLAGAEIWQWWLLWVGVALGAVFMKPTVWMTAIAGRFSRRRGLAMGVAYCGLGLGAALMPFLTNQLVQAWGWRAGYVSLAAIACATTLPMILLFFRDPPTRADAAGNRADLPGVGIAEGFLSSRYIRIALTAFLAAAATIGITVHFVPMLVAQSISRSEAASLASVIGLASIAGRIITGYLLDRLNGPVIGAIAFGLPILACLWLLAFEGALSSAIGIAVIIGFALGAETDIIGYLSARYFGLRNYGVLFGTIVGLLTCAAGVGPMIGGVIHDSYGTYDPMIWGAIPIFVFCALMIGSLGAYPTHQSRAVNEKSSETS